MSGCRWVAIALISAGAVGEARSQATVFWTGASSSSPNFDDANNWTALAVPANNGSQILGFYSADASAPNGNQMTLDVPVNALGLDIEANRGGANISLTTATGAGLTLGASGIWMNQIHNNSSSVATIAVPVILGASQTWSIADSNLDVIQPITGLGKALAIQDTSGAVSVTLNSGASTFSGGLTVSGGAIVYADANSSGPAGSPTSGPAGTGTITLNSASELLAPSLTTITLGNNVVLGSGVQVLGAASGGLLIETGTISGGGPLQPASALTLDGTNTYTGGTTIENNVLVVAGSSAALGTGFVTLNGGGATLGIGSTAVVPNVITTFANGSILEGYGSFAPLFPDFLNVAHGSVIVGGKGSLPFDGFASSAVPGTLTIGGGTAHLILGNQGIMQFSIMNATGSAGTDYSTISAPLTPVNVTAIAATPFTIQLVSVSPATGQLGLANFNNTQPYSWTILTSLSITGFSSSSFAIDPSTDFQNALGGGTFSLIESGGNSLVLDFTPVPEPSTWALLATGILTAGTAVRRRRR